MASIALAGSKRSSTRRRSASRWRTRRAAQDAAREALGGLDVDVQAEQVLAGLGQDLGQARGRAQVVGGARVGAPGRLEHDDRLEHAGVEPVALGDAVDDRPPVRGALRAEATTPPGLLA